MKKLLCLFAILVLCSSQIASAYTELDEQIRAIRVVKNAKTRPINAQIKQHNTNIEQIALDTKLTEKQRQAKLAKEEAALSKLHAQKDAIQKQYNKDKKELKKAYKAKNKKK